MRLFFFFGWQCSIDLLVKTVALSFSVFYSIPVIFLYMSCYFFCFVRIFVTTIWRHNHFKSGFCSFIHEISTEMRTWVNRDLSHSHKLLQSEIDFLIAALIFSAGYYSAPIFLSNKKMFRFTSFPLFQHFALYLFDFSRLVSLFSHSAKSDFEHQLLSKWIQNEQSQYKKLKSEIETG